DVSPPSSESGRALMGARRNITDSSSMNDVFENQKNCPRHIENAACRCRHCYDSLPRQQF
ncbi:hypothetical protein JMJ77_0007746, partial [Colletotrichum scovillei]